MLDASVSEFNKLVVLWILSLGHLNTNMKAYEYHYEWSEMVIVNMNVQNTHVEEDATHED